MSRQRINTPLARAILFLFVSSCTPLLQAEPWLVGNALSTDSGELLYRELHYRDTPSAKLSERVEYVDPQGELMVEKTLDDSLSSIMPNVEQTDLRTGTRFVVTNDSANFMKSTYRRAGADVETARIEKDEQLIIDAGFDPYVRAHWEALEAGEAVRGTFFVPARLDTVQISIRETDSEQCADIAVATLCLVVRPAGFLRLVSWFVDPLYLAYERGSQRLLMYRGLSNILDNEGKAQDVVIRYEYASPAS